VNIHPVQNIKDLNAFIELPYRLYKNDPIWIPPLRDEQHGQFDPKRNPLLDHCAWQLFLLEDAGQVIGRIAAFIDTLAVDFWKEAIGLFGYYECIPDPSTGSLVPACPAVSHRRAAVACGTNGGGQARAALAQAGQAPAAGHMLLEAARDWLRSLGMKSMRGPWSFVSQEWGMVVEGFKPSPVIMAPYNPPCYNDHLTSFGLEKVKDLLCWYVSAAEGHRLPERIVKLTDTVQKRYGVRIRQVDMKHYEQEVQNIIELSNASIIANWGYSPVTEAEVQAMARDMKPIIQPKGVLFAEDKDGRPIGFAITLPDVNSLLKGLNGHLFPFGFIKLMWGIPRLRRYRMFALGVIPEYQGKAVDSLLYRALNDSLYAPDLWMEINYVLEDNWPMINAIKKLGALPLRRFRVYEMKI
jgi:GNAT superfamily N-acetyltransferase